MIKNKTDIVLSKIVTSSKTLNQFMKIIKIEEEKDQKHSALKNIAKDVLFPLTKEDRALIRSMEKVLYELEGIGLAAPQVDIAKRIALIYIPESASLLRDNATTVPMHTIINPEYTPVNKEEKKSDFEGCYSVASVMGKISRFNTINVKYQNEEGEVIEKTVSGFYARALQHEIDHLNGILITDHLTPDCLSGDVATMLKLRRDSLSEEQRKSFDELMRKKTLQQKS